MTDPIKSNPAARLRPLEKYLERKRTTVTETEHTSQLDGKKNDGSSSFSNAYRLAQGCAEQTLEDGSSDKDTSKPNVDESPERHGSLYPDIHPETLKQPEEQGVRVFPDPEIVKQISPDSSSSPPDKPKPGQG